MFSFDSRILVVAEASGLRDEVKQRLSCIGYMNILEAVDGDSSYAALESSKKQGNPVGLILCDIQMRDLDGLALLKKLRHTEDYVNLPVLMITGEEDSLKIVKIINLGVSSYIFKPISLEVLKRKLHTVWCKHHAVAQQRLAA